MASGRLPSTACLTKDAGVGILIDTFIIVSLYILKIINFFPKVRKKSTDLIRIFKKIYTLILLNSLEQM